MAIFDFFSLQIFGRLSVYVGRQQKISRRRPYCQSSSSNSLRRLVGEESVQDHRTFLQSPGVMVFNAGYDYLVEIKLIGVIWMGFPVQSVIG